VVRQLPPRYDAVMFPVTTTDVIVIVAGAIQVGGLVFLGVYLSAMLRECQRLTTAVAGMVVQEEEKTRALVRRQSN
jgi:hypothetical protein